MCDCSSKVTVGGYQNTVTIEIPPHMGDYRSARVAAGLTPLLSIDRCALPEMLALWSKGIHTRGCCCGHNTVPSMVNVREEDDAKMEALGYVRWPQIPEGCCRQTFFLKTVGSPK
jgi:hypothetical protein